MQYAPELLGKCADMPQLEGESPEDVKAYQEQIQERMEKALAIPATEFDIDFHSFRRECGNISAPRFIAEKVTSLVDVKLFSFEE